jgi:hypothetical protein
LHGCFFLIIQDVLHQKGLLCSFYHHYLKLSLKKSMSSC